MKTANEILDMVNEFLEHLPYDRKPSSLYEPIQYVLSMGGKRIRPTLMLMAYNLYQENPEKILMNDIALETYHNYTLLHDDLMDNADMRRGKLTVHKKWDANTAILSGDSMLVLAYERMAHFDAKHLQAVLQLFTETALEIGEGQQYDMEFETRDDVKEEEYIEMIRLKTSVLLACALKMGALLGGAPAADAEKLYAFGIHIGLAFQLQDDLLDVYGDPRTFGKHIGGDILCNKKTFLLINALRLADAAQRTELMDWIARKDFDPQEKIEAVTHIYNVLGLKALTEARIEALYEEANANLRALSVSVEQTAILKAVCDKLMHRQV